MTAEAAVPTDFEDVLVIGAITQPTALAFTPDGRLLITRQPGVLRVYASGSLLATPAITLTSMCTASEQGLLGVAVDPDFASNSFIYVYYTINKSGTCVNRVSRFVLPATNIIAPASQVVLLDNIHSPAGTTTAATSPSARTATCT
jgi:glucose/arabinose dehydrogenase